MVGQKRLVVCFDGTWNNADTSGDAATNVERLARSVRGSSGDLPQIVLYLRGVGSTGSELQRLIAGATGEGVNDNIRSAYMFLAQNYLPEREEGGEVIPADEIFLFGFSRGAFTARSLAGFMSAAGLLKRQRLEDLPSAWAYYRSEGPHQPESFCDAYRSDCHREPNVKFLGVWDTVGALGIPDSVLGFQLGGNEFHDTAPSKIVKNAYHALAIDEHRDEFVPTLWTGTVPNGCKIEQCWFAGAHSDVGGGYRDRTLADIPLLWMAEKAEACGLRLDWESGLLPREDASDPCAPQHESRVGLAVKDLLTPTIRQIAGASFGVSFLERIYFPRDPGSQEPLQTINETVHPSARDRLHKEVVTIHDEKAPPPAKAPYEPRNLLATIRT